MPRAHPCILLGYPLHQKAYTVLNLVTKNVHIARDVKFFEEIFPLHSLSTSPISNTQSHFPLNSQDTSTSFVANNPNPSDSSQNDDITLAPNPPVIHDSVPTSRPSRTRQPPSHLKYYICNFVDSSSHVCCHTITNLCIPHNSVDQPLLNSTHPIQVFNVTTSIVEPAFFHEAKGNPNWEDAMKQELVALDANRTWDIVKLPKGKKPISCRWVYKLKYKSDGSIDRYKARLVAKVLLKNQEEIITRLFLQLSSLTPSYVLFLWLLKEGGTFNNSMLTMLSFTEISTNMFI